MPSSPRVLARMDERAQIIAGELTRLAAVFTDKAIFSGPSLHFHRRAIDLRRRLGSVREAVASSEFHELVYATLTAWGMHRMGPGNTKLRELDYIVESVKRFGGALSRFDKLRLSVLPKSDVAAVARAVWEMIEQFQISIAEARIVANSKLLDHFLSDLHPAVDRTYTYNVSTTGRSSAF